jgi:cytochrome b
MTKIWTLPTILVHWFLAVFLIIAYILGGEEESLQFHSALGIAAGVLIVFRLIWGLIGPKYSRFRDFPMRISTLTSHLKTMGKAKEHAGHNPLASYVMTGIMVCVLLVTASGLMTLNPGWFGLTSGGEGEGFGEIHEVFVNILLILVILHLIGLAADFVLNRKTGTVASMFTGRKNLEAEPARLNAFQKIFSLIWLLLPMAALYWVMNSTNPVFQSTEGDKTENASGNEDGESEEDDD